MNSAYKIVDQDAVNLMNEWACWVRTGDAIKSLAYKAVTPYMKDFLPSQGCTFLEANAVKVEKAMCWLIDENEPMGIITALYYLDDFNYMTLAEHLEKHGYDYSRKNISQFVDSGTNTVYGAVSSM